MGKISRFLAGTTLGTLVGIASALLLAPEKGEGLRHTLRSRLDTIQEEARRAAEAQRAALEAELARLRGED